MKLFKYVLKEYFKFVFGTILLCLFLFVLFDFIHKTSSYFNKYNPSPDLILRFYFYQIPFQILQIIPIASLIASVVVFVLLNRGNEITAMRAAGMNPLQVSFPLIVGGTFLTILSFVISEAIVPKTSQKMHYITEVQIEGNNDESSFNESHWIRNNLEFFNFSNYTPASQTLHQVKVMTMNPETFTPQKAIHAATARYLPETKKWVLNQVKFLEFNDQLLLESTKSQDHHIMPLPLEPEKLKVDRRQPNELSILELDELIAKNTDSGADVLGFRIAWHIKWAYPFAALIISLIGLQFGYRSERTTETVKNIMLSFSIGISYWFILSAARALGSAGNLPPFLAGWSANIVLGLIIARQIWKVRLS